MDHLCRKINPEIGVEAYDVKRMRNRDQDRILKEIISLQLPGIQKLLLFSWLTNQFLQYGSRI